MEKSSERLKILEKIDEYESLEKWDVDVELDPETYELLPNKVDYLNKKLSSKIATAFANRMGARFFENLIKQNQFIIKEVKGIENFLSVKGGAFITCNHFNACDNYAVWRAIRPYMGKKRLYKIIREGNYTNPPKPFGLFMKHCNTLPLSSNSQTMKKLMGAMKELLSRGEKILIYPEQAMWWNYRKPRPMKSGAFRFSLSYNVPIIPVFITMEDSEYIDPNGFPVQAYTINFLQPIYPNTELPKKEAVDILREYNYRQWKDCYENFYGEKLVYKNKN